MYGKNEYDDILVSGGGEPLRELALFAGIGGGILGGKLLGWRTVCAVEIEPFCQQVLRARQDEGALERFPIFDDVRAFDGRAWRGRVDVISGGFPCQDISCAGKGGGIDAPRSGLWREFARIIREVRPRFALVENSPMLRGRGLSRVLGDLAAAGYDAAWAVLSAADVGAPHLRRRMWIVAVDGDVPDAACGGGDSSSVQAADSRARFSETGVEGDAGGVCRGVPASAGNAGRTGAEADVARSARAAAIGHVSYARDAGAARREQRAAPPEKNARRENDHGRRDVRILSFPKWASESGICRVADGIPHRVERLKGLGNAQVPLCAATAFVVLRGELELARRIAYRKNEYAAEAAAEAARAAAEVAEK